jgi:hypothetical protein
MRRMGRMDARMIAILATSAGIGAGAVNESWVAAACCLVARVALHFVPAWREPTQRAMNLQAEQDAENRRRMAVLRAMPVASGQTLEQRK